MLLQRIIEKHDAEFIILQKGNQELDKFEDIPLVKGKEYTVKQKTLWTRQRYWRFVI